MSVAPQRGPRAGRLAGVLVVAGRELGAAFDSGLALVVAAAFAVLAGTAFMNEFFLSGRVDMAPWFERLPWLYLVFLPAISMRTWAEERRARTLEVLLSFPLEPSVLVLGKFAAVLVELLLLLSSSLPIVGLLLWLGSPDPGLVLGGYLAAGSGGALLLAIGLVVSSLVRDQLGAFVLTVVAAAFLVLSGHERVVAVLDGFAPGLELGSLLRGHVSLLPHFERLARGVLDLPALVYFAGGVALCLWGNAVVLARVRD